MLTPSPIKPPVSIEDVQKLDVRIGTILRVEEVDGSDKLMKLSVEFGNERRCVLAGIRKERADPTEIEGLQALFIVNLPPRKMAGVVSEAMLFDIGFDDGISPVLAVPEKTVPDGARAG
jgi:tRNA-binding protein